MSKELLYREKEIDALTEVCSIGAGHAATALSQLIDRKIIICVPNFKVVAISDLPGIMGGPENRIIAVYARVLGALTGNMLFMLPQQSAMTLAASLRGSRMEADQLSNSDREIIKQAGTVTISSYLSALTRFLDMPLIPSATSIANDMAGAILDVIAIELGEHTDYGLMVQTEFVDDMTKISARICFLPEPEAQQAILRRLGVK